MNDSIQGKELTLLLLIMLKCFELSAQDSLSLEKYYPKPKITSFELLLGPNISTIRGINPTASYAGGPYYVTMPYHRIGVSLGIGVTYQFKKRFALSTRFTWEQKGIMQKTDSISFLSTGAVASVIQVWTRETNNNYFVISITPQWLLGARYNVNLGAGGYFGLMEKSRVIFTNYSTGQTSLNSQGNFDNYDWGLSFNGGYTFSLQPKLLFTIQATCSYGLAQLSSLGTSQGSAPWYNTSYSVLIGTRFPNRKIRK